MMLPKDHQNQRSGLGRRWFSASVQETECRRVFMAKELGRGPSDHPETVPASDGGL